MRLETFVSNVQHHSSLTLLITNVDHAHKDIPIILLLQDVNAQFHVPPQGQLTQQIINANAHLIQKEPQEFIIPKLICVIAQLIFHCGMENIVWFAQQELNMIQIKDNVIIALKDLLEIPPAIVAFQDFEQLINLLCGK
jgi:hypothetical protein